MTVTAVPAQPQHDDLLGICAAIGHDFGFDPLWLRVMLGAGILWNPAAVLGAYLGLGVLVLATRWLFPDSKPVHVEQPATAVLPEAANEQVPGFAMAA